MNTSDENICDLDNRFPGPYYMIDSGQSGYVVIDAMGKDVTSGQTAYLGDNEDHPRRIVEIINEYVAAKISVITDRSKLSHEFFLRRHGLITRYPRFNPDQARRVAAAYKRIGGEHIADVISGVRCGKKALDRSRKTLAPGATSSWDDFTEFTLLASLIGDGYCTPEELGTDRLEMNLFDEHRLRGCLQSN